jgi:hypothetical protein
MTAFVLAAPLGPRGFATGARPVAVAAVAAAANREGPLAPTAISGMDHRYLSHRSLPGSEPWTAAPHLCEARTVLVSPRALAGWRFTKKAPAPTGAFSLLPQPPRAYRAPPPPPAALRAGG